MSVPLTGEGIRAFRILNEISFTYAVIDFDLFSERESYLCELLADPGSEPGTGGASEVGEDDKKAEANESGEGVPVRAHPNLVGSGRAKEEEDWLQFIPAGPIAYMKRWEFIKGDPDPHPSVPHGHDEGRPFPKLDPYLGWIHVSTKATGGRMSKDDTRALWNDERFREFAAAALVHFVRENPSYVWRVPDPLRLPRRR